MRFRFPRASGHMWILCGLGLALVLAGCLGRPKPKSQAEQPTPRPTPPVRITGGEVPPIDRAGAVLEIDVPAAKRAEGAVGAFQGADPFAAGQQGAGKDPLGEVGPDPALLVGQDPNRPRVVPLSEIGLGTGASSAEEEGELPAPFKEIERTEPRPSQATAEFRRRAGQRADELAKAKTEGRDPNAPEIPAVDLAGRNISLNFENLDIKDLILQLQEMGVLPLNYILDQTVQGTITIRTADAIAPEDLLDVILTVLQANGLTVVKDGDFFRIIAAGDAKSFNIETYVTHSSRVVEDVNEVVTVIVPLEYLSTTQAVAVLSQFADQNSQIIEYQAGNLLFLIGFSARLKRLLQILELVDIGTSREELRVYQIYHTSAEELKATIEQIMGTGDFAARFAEAQAGGRRRRAAPAATGDASRQAIIIADPRSNRLIAFASKRELEFMERIIELLDQEIVVSDKIYVYPVENAEAGALASTLTAIYETEAAAGGAAKAGGSKAGQAAGAAPDPFGTGQTTPGATGQQGVRNRGGRQTSQQRQQQRQQQQQQRKAQTQQGKGTQLFPEGSDASDPDELPEVGLAYVGTDAESETMAQASTKGSADGPEPVTGARAGSPRVVRELSPTGRRSSLERDEYFEDLLLKEGTGLVSGAINVVADERTNFLIVKTAPANWPLIKETIRRLDVQPKQVLIDVLIAEVTLDETNEFGIEWSVLSENNLGDYTFQGTTQTNFGVNGQSTGFTYTLLEATRFRGFLRAFANQNELEVLSRPHLLASNNTEASFEVGNQIPVVTQQFSNTPTTTPATGVFNSIEYRDTGIILSITPRINATNFVTLDADIEISEAQSNTVGGTDQPIIRQRKVTTSVVVQNSTTLLIGGIMESKRDISEQNIPWIRRVPILKNLFGSQKRQVRKTELFIAITPHVVLTPEDASEKTMNFKHSLGTDIDDMMEKGGQPRRWWEP